MARPKAYYVRTLPDLPPEPEPGWRTTSMADLGEADFAAAVLRASEGDPFETSTPGTAVADLREMVEFAGATFDPAAWLVVSDEAGEIGVVLPQEYHDERGRGTLFYLGVVPGRRGEGLGRRLHRYGLGLLRDGGVERYVGSTDLENSAMLAIFEANGCERTK